jgi:hypothetical protein
MTEARNTPQPPADSDSRDIFRDALRYWEPRRIVYNVLLSVVTLAWITLTWPHFRDGFQPQLLLLIVVLAVLANSCYSAAYLADFLVQFAGFQAAWRQKRWILFCSGTLFAILLANYWIADEVYPFVHK